VDKRLNIKGEFYISDPLEEREDRENKRGAREDKRGSWIIPSRGSHTSEKTEGWNQMRGKGIRCVKEPLLNVS